MRRPLGPTTTRFFGAVARCTGLSIAENTRYRTIRDPVGTQRGCHMRRALTTFLALIAPIGLIVAQLNLPALSRNVMIVGVGTSSCGSWTKERQRASAVSFEYGQWVLGYVSAINAHVLERDAHVAKGIDNAGLLAWVDTIVSSTHSIKSRMPPISVSAR